MALGYLIVAGVAATVALFALQNGEPTTIRFLAWELPAVSAGLLVVVALVAGMIVAGLPLLIHRAVLRSRMRRLEGMVSALEHSLKDRDRALRALKPQRRDRPAGERGGHPDDIPA
jgi:uncharacterized integral membrane protein